MKEDAMKKLLRSSNQVDVPEEEWDDLLKKAAWAIKGRGTPEEKILKAPNRPKLLTTIRASCNFCGKPASWDAPTVTGQWAHMCHNCAKTRGKNFYMGFLLRGGK